MKKVNLPYFLARRLSEDSHGAQNGVMLKVAMFSVAVGLAVMIFALGVIFGFKREITNNLMGFGAHVQITHLDGNNSFETEPISADAPFVEPIKKTPLFRSIQPYAIKAGILKGENAIQGVMLKGVDVGYDWSFFREHLVRGDVPRISDTLRTRDVMISETLSKMMEIDVGDKFEMLFIQDPPRRDKFKVSGIYASQFAEMDKMVVLTDIRNVQKLNGWNHDQITGYEVDGRSVADLDQFTADIYNAVSAESINIDDDLMVVNMREKNAMMFDWLDTHDLNALVIIIVMLIVSVFNMIAALLIIMLEKSSFIGVMKAMGMNNGALQRTFLIRSGYVIVRGMIWGNVVGLVLCLVQKYTGVLKLDATGYFLSEVPIFINWGYILLLNVGVFVVMVVCQVLPTLIISKILPEKSIRFE